MNSNCNTNFSLNKFFKNIKSTKKYIKNLKNKNDLLVEIEKTNYKHLSSLMLSPTSHSNVQDNLVTYIIDVNFLRSNTFIHIMDFSGKSKFFYCSGSFNYSGKIKKARSVVFASVCKVLSSKLKFLKGSPVALHLKNVGYARRWILKKLKKYFFVKSVRSFNLYPHNGCRKKKVKRKKLKKIPKWKKWLSGLKRQIVNLLSISS